MKLKYKYILASLNLFCSMRYSICAGDDAMLSPEDKQFFNNQAQILNTRDEFEDSSGTPAVLLGECKNEQAKEAYKLDGQKQTQYKDQNSLLFRCKLKLFDGLNIPFAFFKRDLVESATVGVRVAADALVYKKIRSNRVSAISAALIARIDELNMLLDQTAQAEKQLQEERDNRHPLIGLLTHAQERLERNMLLTPLRGYLEEQCIANTNAYSKEILLPLLVRAGAKELGERAENALILKDYIPPIKAKAFSLNDIIKAYLDSFINNKIGAYLPMGNNGEYKLVQGGVSLTTLVKTAEQFISPSSFLSGFATGSLKYLTGQIGGILGLDRRYNSPIPDRVPYAKKIDDKLDQYLGNNYCSVRPCKQLFDLASSQYASKAIDFFASCLAVKAFDALSNQTWAQYAVENRAILFNLVQEYKQAQASEQSEKILKIEKKIKRFVRDGHQEVSIMPAKWMMQWLYAQAVAAGSIRSHAMKAIMAIWLCKTVHFLHDKIGFGTVFNYARELTGL